MNELQGVDRVKASFVFNRYPPVESIVQSVEERQDKEAILTPGEFQVCTLRVNQMR